MRNPELKAYTGAKYRCTNPKAQAWSSYGARGIEFRFSSFKEFLAEVGTRPPNHYLDRINNDGHYEKGNVRWADAHTSTLNRRTPKHNTSGFRGVTFHKYAKKFEARYCNKYIGFYDTAAEAGAAYEAEARRVL